MSKLTFKGGLVLENPFPAKEIDLIRIPLPDRVVLPMQQRIGEDRKSTRLNSSHVVTSYAVFCLKKKNILVCHNHPFSPPLGL